MRTPALAERVEVVPPAQAFRVKTRPDRERVLVAPCGELDLATVGQVTDEIDALAARGFDALVIDLRETTFLDSTGLHMLLTQTARTDTRITVIEGPRAVSRIFDLVGVRHMLRFEP